KDKPEVVVAVVRRPVLALGGITDACLAGKRVDLVHGGAVDILDAEKEFEKAARSFGIERESREDILRSVAATNAPTAEAQLVQRKVAAPVLGYPALAGIEDVDHGVEGRVRA